MNKNFIVGVPIRGDHSLASIFFLMTQGCKRTRTQIIRRHVELEQIMQTYETFWNAANAFPLKVIIVN